MARTRFPCEASWQRDERTGARIVRITGQPAIHHHLYFLTSSLTPDERHLVFCSYRSGSPQFYRAGFPEGEIVAITDEPEINGFSAIVTPDGRGIYYTAGSRVRYCDLFTGAARTLAEFPGAQLGECSLSADHRDLVTAARLGDRFGLARIATDGSGGRIVFECPRTIIHPQFHPRDPEWIEYAQDPAPRMWLIRRDGTGNTCLYEHDNDCFLVHETWLGEGEELIVVRWPYALLRFHLARRELREIARFNAWHIASSRDGRRVVCDTARPDLGIQLVDVETGERRTVCYPQSSCRGSQWNRDRYALADDFAAARAAKRESFLSWMEMKADTVYGPQWTHPHPSFSPSERWVVYTSDVTGYPQVYAVDLTSLDGAAESV